MLIFVFQTMLFRCIQVAFMILFSALHTSKSLSKNERLILLVEKLQIENERLKKGYTVKGVGADKEFVTTKDLNSK